MAARTCILGHLLPRTLAALLVAMLAFGAKPVLAQRTAHHPGQWTTATPWPGRATYANSVYAVHMALLRGDTLFGRPHSQVMAWGIWAPGSPDGGLWAWNPTTDSPSLATSNLTSRAVPDPPYNVFCAGHGMLANGDLLIVGGTERGYTGEAKSARFKVQDRSWIASPMQSRRWYGNATPPMPDGRMIAFGGNTYDQLIVFGGRNANNSLSSDVQRYGITNQGQWNPPLTGYGSQWPTPREGHSFSSLAIGQTFLFGGKDPAGTTRQDAWKLVRFDNDQEQTYRWSTIAPIGPLPPTRWRHAAVAADVGGREPFLFVHGGESVTAQGTTTLGDLWRLEWVTTPVAGWHWAPITLLVGDVPAPRSGHSAIWDAERGCMVVYGGQNADGSITDRAAYTVFVTSTGAIWKRLKLAGGSLQPAARTRHAMSMGGLPPAEHDHSGFMPVGLVFGGRTASGLSNELWEFSLSANGDSIRWNLRDSGAGSGKPAPRADASIAEYILHPHSYVLFGGELVSSGTDASTWEYRFDAPVGWRRLAASASAVRGQRAFLDANRLTALQPEVFNPENNTWAPFGDPKMRQSYHQMFLASDGKFYSPGPNSWGRDTTWRFDPTIRKWQLYSVDALTPLDGTQSGILYRPDRFMKCGGFASSFEKAGVTKSLVAGSNSRTWKLSTNVMAQHPRLLHTLSMLPTGEVLANGGLGRADDQDADPNDDLPVRRPEIWDPNYTLGTAVGAWYGALTGTLLATEPVTRAYHSASILLPDGRLLSGGGNTPHPDEVKRSVDQYSPPYLFEPDGRLSFRPRLYGAQDHVPYDDGTILVACPDPVVEACLIRPGAATHAFNHDCRYIPLTLVSQEGHRVTLRCEGLNANVAPPGDYLLFVLRNQAGRRVPSVARWVNVGSGGPSYATWDTLPPDPVQTLTVTVAGVPTSRTARWTAPNDRGDGSPGRAARYELRYRAGADMTTIEDFFEFGRRVDPATLPSPGSPGWPQEVTVPGLSPDTTYYFRLIARDGAGSDRNWSGLSNEAAAIRLTMGRFAIRTLNANPSEGPAMLELELPAPAPVRLEIMDLQGRRIRVVTDQVYATGTHRLVWDGRDASGERTRPGVYFYRVTAGNERSQGRLVRLP